MMDGSKIPFSPQDWHHQSLQSTYYESHFRLKEQKGHKISKEEFYAFKVAVSSDVSICVGKKYNKHYSQFMSICRTILYEKHEKRKTFLIKCREKRETCERHDGR